MECYHEKCQEESEHYSGKKTGIKNKLNAESFDILTLTPPCLKLLQTTLIIIQTIASTCCFSWLKIATLNRIQSHE